MELSFMAHVLTAFKSPLPWIFLLQVSYFHPTYRIFDLHILLIVSPPLNVGSMNMESFVCFCLFVCLFPSV